MSVSAKLTSFHTSSDLSGCAVCFTALCVRLPVVSSFVELNRCWQTSKDQHCKAAEPLNHVR